MPRLSLTAASFMTMALLVVAAFAPWPAAADGTAVTHWMQVNSSGFGSAQNSSVGALSAFENQLYAGTWNDTGAQVWRSADGRAWSQFTPAWPVSNTAVYDMKPFGGRLYAGTLRDPDGAEVWRTDGVAWTRVVTGGFGDANNLVVSALAAFGGQLYAAAGNLATGIEMWRSATGNASSWSQVNADGFGAGPTWENAVLDVYSNHLYTGFSRLVSGKGRAELWRTANGTTWTPVFTDGLGNSNNADVASLAAFRGQLYVGLRNPSTGGEVWRAGDGLSFSPVFTGGLGNAANRGAYGLIEFEDQLYAVFSNVGAGAEVWRTSDGAAWSRIGQGGWGDNDNRFADYFDKGAAIFEDRLYIGTLNDAAGGQIWLLLSRPAYLPIIRREDAQR